MSWTKVWWAVGVAVLSFREHAAELTCRDLRVSDAGFAQTSVWLELSDDSVWELRSCQRRGVQRGAVETGVEGTLSLKASMAAIMSPPVATVSEAAEESELAHERNSCMAWHGCTAAELAH